MECDGWHAPDSQIVFHLGVRVLGVLLRFFVRENLLLQQSLPSLVPGIQVERLTVASRNNKILLAT